jgi:hypothetical protein
MELEKEIITLTQKLLDAITSVDWDTYEFYTHPNVTCFEPEAKQTLVEGLQFHKYYFTFAKGSENQIVNTTICSPKVNEMAPGVCLITYIRLIQRVIGGVPVTVKNEESRIWKKFEKGWKQIHLHRS